MARYGMDYDRGFRGSGGYARDYRDGGDWDRDEFTAGTREYNAMHNDWHINRGWNARGGDGQTWNNRPVAGSYDYDAGRDAPGSFDQARPSRNWGQGGHGEAGWAGWSVGRGGQETGGYGASDRSFGGYVGGRGYDVDDFQRFTTGRDRGFQGGGYTGGFSGGSYPAAGYNGGGYNGGGYTGGGYNGGGYNGGGYNGGGYNDVGGRSSGWNGGYSGGYTGGGMNRGGTGNGASGWNRDYDRDFDHRGYDQDLGDRVREGWDHLRDRARNIFRR